MTSGLILGGAKLDELLKKARKIVVKYDSVGNSLFQRELAIGYKETVILMDALEKAHVVGPLEKSGTRQVLINSRKP